MSFLCELSGEKGEGKEREGREGGKEEGGKGGGKRGREGRERSEAEKEVEQSVNYFLNRMGREHKQFGTTGHGLSGAIHYRSS